jgi:protein O-mannosyl-transferase
MMSRRTHQRAIWLGLCFVFVCALLAYGSSLAGEYCFDDFHSVHANGALYDLGNLGRFWTDPSLFSGTSARMYRPTLLTSLALNLALSPAAWSLKLGNLLLHATNAVLLCLWWRRLSGRLRAAVLLGAVFAVHPLLSEAVNLVSGRSELLAATGVLTGLLAHLAWQRSGSWLAFATLPLATVLACGSKETGVVLPLLCGLQSLCHGSTPRAGWLRIAVGLAPMLLVVGVYLWARSELLGQVAVPLLDRAGDDPLSGHGRALLTQLATMATLLPVAMRQVVWPWPLRLDPDVVYRSSLAAPAVLAGAALLLGLTTAALWRGPAARLRRVAVALAWLPALPWILVPLNAPMAEHRLYLPLAGVLATVSVPLRRWLRIARHRLPDLRHWWAMPATAALLLGALGSASRSWLYRDERLLWEAELVHNPQAFRTWWSLGASRRRHGDLLGAVEPLATAHRLYPQHFDTLVHYVEVLLSLPDASADPARTQTAVAALQALGPQDPWVRTLAARAALQAGRLQQDRQQFECAEQLALSCLQIAEPKGYVYQLAAEARRGLGDLAGALQHLDTSISLGLQSTAVRLDRSAVLRELGQPAEARRELLRAQAQDPMNPALLQALQQPAAPGR